VIVTTHSVWADAEVLTSHPPVACRVRPTLTPSRRRTRSSASPSPTGRSAAMRRPTVGGGRGHPRLIGAVGVGWGGDAARAASVVRWCAADCPPRLGRAGVALAPPSSTAVQTCMATLFGLRAQRFIHSSCVCWKHTVCVYVKCARSVAHVDVDRWRSEGFWVWA
jgi:hypothetical protein